jgi:UDP-N-acetylmuramoyl-tripeptide--D-alanyl-D-alanine ligase
LFLGDMFELGESSNAEHQSIIQLCEKLQFKNVILIGSEFSKINSNYKCFHNISECMNHIKSLSINDSSVLIKGSRSMKMEALLDAL